MGSAFDQLLESPDNLEYLAEQSRLLNVSPRRFLQEMGAISRKGNGSLSRSQLDAKSFQDLVAEAKALLQSDRARNDQADSVSSTHNADIEESAYDAAMRLGIIGFVKSSHNDLSTNPKHFEGFGT